MSSNKPSPRLVHLLSRLSDGLLEPIEAAELDEILLHDASARDYYRSHAAVHLALSAVRTAGEGTIETLPAGRRIPGWPAFAAAAALVLAAGAAWWSVYGGRKAPPAVAQLEMPPAPVLAVTSAADGVAWDLPQAPESGQRLGLGRVRVASGELSLSLVGGQTVQIRGPAEFEFLADGEFALYRGPAAFKTIGSQSPFIVHLPTGALVDTGSAFSAEVAADGTTAVHVFERQLTVSTIGASGRTQEEVLLKSGRSILVNQQLSLSTRPAGSFLRVPPAPITTHPGAEDAYAAGVLASSPAAYWRFQALDAERRVPDETGNHPLELVGKARLGGSGSQQFLLVNTGDASGFAATREGIPGLDTARGLTVECLLFPSAENHGTAVAFELAETAPVSLDIPAHINHAPQTLVIERMGRKGEHIGHLHPDFALRAMFRSPAGYVGGTNVYSRESHLLHRWIHVAAVHEGTRILLYVDGKLSDSIESSLPFNNALLRPIIGRLQPHPRDEQRQWIGGIDEVALYGRALSADEIRAHAAALKH
jgi:ferric-dicitrate binding protein FerR (iron transport regulator)